MSEGQSSTLTAAAEPQPDTDRIRPWALDAAGRGGNGKLRLLGLLTVAVIGGMAAWDLRRRGLPTRAEIEELAPHLLLTAPLLAGLGMLLGRRPPTWAGLLLGGGTWSVVGAVWSVRWLVNTGGGLLDGDQGVRAFAADLTWVPYVGLVLLGLVTLTTVLVLRGHGARRPCHTRAHQFLTVATALAALLGPLWVLALVPAMGLGLRQPHRTAAVTWLGWVMQGVAALTLAANGRIPSSGLPALVLHPSAPTALLLSLPLFVVAALAGALAALPASACKDEAQLDLFAPTTG